MGSGGGAGRPGFVLEPQGLKPRLPAKVKTVLELGEARILRKEKLEQKSRQCGHASENRIQELCRESVRRARFQGYIVPESHFHKHICTVLTFAGKRGLRAHSTETWLPKTPGVTCVTFKDPEGLEGCYKGSRSVFPVENWGSSSGGGGGGHLKSFRVWGSVLLFWG